MSTTFSPTISIDPSGSLASSTTVVPATTTSFLAGAPGAVVSTPGAVVSTPGAVVTTPGAVVSTPGAVVTTAEPANYVTIPRVTQRTFLVDSQTPKIQVVKRKVPVKEFRYVDVPGEKQIVIKERKIPQIQVVEKEVLVPTIQYVEKPVYVPKTVEQEVPITQVVYKKKPVIKPHFIETRSYKDDESDEEVPVRKSTQIDKTVISAVKSQVQPVGNIPKQNSNARRSINEMLPSDALEQLKRLVPQNTVAPVVSPPVMTPKPSKIINDFAQLAKINQNKELFHNLYSEGRLPPKIFLPPSDLKEIIDLIRSQPEKSATRGKYLAYPIATALNTCLAGKHIPSEYLDMVEYIILNLDIYFNDFDEAEMEKIINEIKIPSSETTLNGQIEEKLTKIICEKIKEETEDSSIVTYADIINAFMDRNEYFPELIYYLNFIN